MIRRGLVTLALVLATAPLAAQTAPPGAKGQKSAVPQQRATTQYVPAVMQQRMATLAGCIQQEREQGDYVLAGAKLSQQGDVAQGTQGAGATVATTYRIEGISGARLSVLVGKHVDVTGAFQGDPKQAPAKGNLPRFEATNVVESEGSCS